MTDRLSYDLSPWYLNKRRVMELTSQGSLDQRLQEANLGGIASDEYLAKLRHDVALKDALGDWIIAFKPPTLGQVILAGNEAPGVLFTHYSDYNCRGLRRYVQAREAKCNVSAMSYPEIYTDVNLPLRKLQLRVPYDPVHLTSASAHVELSGPGRKQLLVIGIIDRVESNLISAKPIAITSILADASRAWRENTWRQKNRIYVEMIDTFERVQHEPSVSSEDINVLKDIREDEVIAAFADIIGEPFVPKHSGNEKSDLFSDRLVFSGERIDSAWMFKGPSVFRPLRVRDCGATGDQVIRLFRETAELFVLQHCHQVITEVRHLMEMEATQLHPSRLYCIIDGADTLRILRAYAKCGQSPAMIRNSGGDEGTVYEVPPAPQ